MFNVSIIGINGKIGKELKKYINEDINYKLMNFIEKNYNKIDLCFICIESLLVENYVNICEKYNIKIIDLSRKYRDEANTPFKENNSNWYYGVPECKIKKYTNKIANPGCSSITSIIGLLPLFDNFIDFNTFFIDVKFSKSTLSNKSKMFNNKDSISLVRTFDHVHELEILNFFNNKIDLFYISSIVDIPNGISLNIMTTIKKDLDVFSLFKDYYQDNDDVLLSDDKSFELNEVLNTNKVGIFIKQKERKLLINIVIDNLKKAGAYTAYLNSKIILEV